MCDFVFKQQFAVKDKTENSKSYNIKVRKFMGCNKIPTLNLNIL